MLKTILPLMIAVMIGGVACQTTGPDTTPKANTPVAKAPVVAKPVQSAKVQSLVFLTQEEKLAYDLYVHLGKKYNHRTFNNIQQSESRHMAAMNRLLSKRNVTDPNAGLKPGQFTDAKLQGMYDKLKKQGEVSLTAALRVGALIEEHDIADLSAHLAKPNNDEDVVRVLTNLRRASYNHLDGFVSAVEKETGTAYVPQVLAVGVYKAARAKGAEHHKGMGKGKGKGKQGHSCQGEGESCDGCKGHH